MLRAASTLARATALLLLAVVATACVGTAGAVTPSPTPVPDPDRIVFRVDDEGGFVMPGTQLGRLPRIVVYADGRVIVAGPQIEIYPAPLVPALQVRTLTPEALARLVALARDKDLLRDATYDAIGIADATTTVLRINIDGTTTTVSAYALSEAGDQAGAGDMDAASRAGRAALRSFIDTLVNLPDADFAGDWAVYTPTALKLIASPYGAGPDDVPAVSPVAWPLGDLDTAGVPVGDGSLGLRCIEVRGADLATLSPVLAAANGETHFTSGGGTFSLIVRPLLPGEPGC